MKVGWASLSCAVALATVVSACGSKSDDGRDEPSPSKAEATKALDNAFGNFVDANTGRFRAQVVFYGQALRVEGTWDLERERGDSVLSQPSLGREGAVDGAIEMRSRSIGSHVYGGPSFGPAAKCWFDYGDDANVIQGLPDSNPQPWVHPAMTVPTESRALGFVNENPSEIAVEVWADSAMSVVFNKVMIAHHDELPTKQSWAPGTITLRDGEYSSVKVPLDGVIDALESGGVEFTDEEDVLLSEARSVVLTIAFDQFGSPVKIEAPAEETLVPVTAGADEDDDLELCDAAAK